MSFHRKGVISVLRKGKNENDAIDTVEMIFIVACSLFVFVTLCILAYAFFM